MRKEKQEKIWLEAKIAAGYQEMADLNLKIAAEFAPLEQEAEQLAEQLIEKLVDV